MRAALILGLGLVALPAAPAAALQEVPFRTLPGGNVASCLRATGTEGGLAAIGPLGRRSTPTDLLATGPERPAVRARVRFGIAEVLGLTLAGLAGSPSARRRLSGGGLRAVQERSWEAALGRLAEGWQLALAGNRAAVSRVA